MAAEEGSSGGRKVLIAMDGSEHSFYAFDWYMQFIYTQDTEVIVAHSGNCNRHRPFQLSVMSSDPAMISRMIHQEEEEVNSIVSKIKDKLTQHGVKGKLLRLSGEAGHSIVKTAEMEGVSCIVTGTRGQGKVRRTLLGSVSDYILNHAHVPVLICRHKEVAGSSDSQ
ncbi:uncharacterized protein LOC112571557 isoform X2 [Pomacea canaliculata]|uniref:uncharacterized protein LOC112571557 isoform X2 n=1 Tax=Pomacea canaliculata TaxID=400727 RepID=UPI000D739681|nr:uncharacterized protein LOC112571557 isoform X2 [Pomacea canaliculata]